MSKYVVRFNSEKFKSRNNRKSWEDQLRNDFAVAINGKEFLCDTDLDLENRLSFIAGNCYSNKNKDMSKVWDKYEKDEKNYFKLSNDRYNTQRLKYGVYGIAQGYIDFDKVLKEVKEEGFKSIPFSSFYDIRQGNFFKGCFVEISLV